MITSIIIKMQLRLLSPNTGFTYLTSCLYSVHMASPQRAHDALEDPTALPHRPHSALSNTLCKRHAAALVLSMFKINSTAWRSRRLHSVFTAFPQLCWRLHSAHLGDLQLFWTLWKRFEDTALVWQGFLQRQHDVSIASLQRLWRSYSAHDVSAACPCASSQRVHSVADDCTARTSAVCILLERCGNAIRTPLWCNRGFMQIRHQSVRSRRCNWH